ncbi:MAG: hypothetical protein H7246_08235 [Phycisphaerae bacterium]|nr:hypothetical protein [Saprospiraceae bacterium]
MTHVAVLQPTNMDVFSSLAREISRALSPDLPNDLGNMDAHLDFILPKVIPYGEDLRETQFWLDKRWKEVREEEGFHEAILHIFSPGGEYLLSIDGNLMKGAWRQLGEENALIVEMSGNSELFDLRFLNGEFMVLTKHGDQARKGLRRFFMLVNESRSRSRSGVELDWRNIMEKLFNVWRENSLSIWAWIFFLLILGAIIYASF